jgi:FkbM family methyltransferase
MNATPNPKVLFVTWVYNGAGTLPIAVESILKQTYENFVYYIIDNASTDKTLKTAVKYTKRDPRIKYLRRDVNEVNLMLYDWIMNNIPEDYDYFVCLDADDEYKPAFLTNMLTFIQMHDLDVACCGSDFINTSTRTKSSERLLPEDMLLTTSDEFDRHLPTYYQFMRTSWAKVISVKVLQQLDLKSHPENDLGAYGSDTLFSILTYQAANRVGILAEPLHNYFVSPHSVSFRVAPKRVESGNILDKAARQFLTEKCGSVSSQNDDFLQRVYFSAVKATVPVLSKSNLSDEKKLEGFRYILTSDESKHLLAQNNSVPEINEQFDQIIKWIDDHGGNKETDENEFLKGINKKLITFMPQTTNFILKNDYRAAFDAYFAESEKLDVTADIEESYITLGKNLAAATQDSATYLSFQKIWITYLIDNNRQNDAKKELDDWLQLLPADNELLDLKTKLESEPETTATASTPTNTTKITNTHENGCDIEFHNLIEYLKNNTVNKILEESAQKANEWKTKEPWYFNQLSQWHKNLHKINAFSLKDNNYVTFFGDRIKYLKSKTDDISNLYEQLGNYRSKFQLKTILQFWLTFTPRNGSLGVDNTFMHYFDLDVIKCDENEVFVDCGAYNGDTILSFINNYGGKYKSIYGYELIPSTYNKAIENLQKYERVFVRNAGVSDKNGTMKFYEFDNAPEANRLHQSGNRTGKVVKMDDDIKEDITFIKMDIEGAEIAALHGAVNHIKRSKPKLAISVYHSLSDLIDIPNLIHQWVPEYKFYFQHCPGQAPFPTEYVLLATVNQKESPIYANPITTTIEVKTPESIVFVGINSSSQNLNQYINKKPEKYNLLHLCDETGKNSGRIHEDKKIIDLKQLAKLYRAGKVDKIIVSYSGWSFPYTNIYKLLKNEGVNDKVYTVPHWFYENPVDLESCLVKADMNKAVIDFIQSFIVTHCNFSCKGCITVSPLAEPWMVDIERYRNDIEQLSKSFWNIARYRITGGESLLHPHVTDMVSIARNIFPATEMAVQTNGQLLLKDVTRFEPLLNTMRTNHCAFQISAYKPTYSDKDRLEKILKEYGVKWHWAGYTIPIESFGKKMSLKPSGNMKEQHKNCGAESVCHTLHEGYLYSCGYPLYANTLEKHFAANFEGLKENIDKMRINIHETTLTGWEIEKINNSPTPFCGYCNIKKQQAFNWEQLHPGKHKLEDYLI